MRAPVKTLEGKTEKQKNPHTSFAFFLYTKTPFSKVRNACRIPTILCHGLHGCVYRLATRGEVKEFNFF